MDKLKDSEGAGRADDATDTTTEQSVDVQRRHFSRAAIAGSAVLLSLGNRSAWGTGGQVVDCMSVMTLNSFHPETGMFTSSPAGRPEHNLELAREIHRIGGAPDYIGRDGTWQTCQDPIQSDNICLVRGECPE